jgi:tripartite-type tricarboxylate transporter receptor subunit TctC
LFAVIVASGGGLRKIARTRKINPIRGGAFMKFAAALLAAASAACVAFFASPAQAQAKPWPDKPVRIIIPFAPGGSVDIIGRMTASRLTEKFGEQFVVDNRTGAGGTIAAAITARANPDGYTLIMLSPGFPASAALYKLPYDPVRDFAAIGMIAEGPLFLVLHPSVKAAGVKEFVELARVSPDGLRYGSGGVGSSTHLATELFRQMAKVSVTHVPYKGVGAALVDLLGGQIQFYISPGAAVLPHAAAGRLRLLAVTGEQRSADMPDLPAISETVPGYAATFWYGLAAPAGTPAAIIGTINQEIARVVKLPDVQKRLRGDDLRPNHSTPEAFAQRITRDIAMWMKVVKAGNIKVE